MFIRELFQPKSIGIIFGRFNPPHRGHRAAWTMASENKHWYVGTNQSTQGPKDPLPYNIKVKVMEAVWPAVKGHIVSEHSWLTLASKIYETHGPVVLKVYTDEKWVTETLDKYNGVANKSHGGYNFKEIISVPTPRLSSATSLREAVASNDRDAFSEAAGLSADTLINDKSFFDVVAEHLRKYQE